MSWAIPHLKRRTDFVRAARQGRSWAMPGLVVQVRQRTGPANDAQPKDEVRVGLTASRKVGGAVVRNRIRRRLRAVAETVLPRLGKPGCDYVLIGRAATASRPFSALIADLEAALIRLQRSPDRVRRAPDMRLGSEQR